MRSRCILVALAVACLNTLTAVFVQKSIMAVFVICFAITIGGIALLYYWLTEPINAMRKHVEEMKEENRQIENMRSEFVANVSHELKTPLTSISGFIETLQAGAAEDPEIRTRFIEIISIETARLKRLIDDILVLSDIESQMTVESKEINVSDVIDEIFEILTPIAGKRGISMINQVDSRLQLVGSEDKFRQMMVNLIENAIKYGKDEGNVWVIGKITENEKIITVKDDGIGIDNEDLDRIAERFYRVDKSRSRKVGGTGLGLSIVKHTAALFNGVLTVSSEPGEGSEFSIVMEADDVKKQK